MSIEYYMADLPSCPGLRAILRSDHCNVAKLIEVIEQLA